MHDWLKRNQKKLLAVLGALLMVTFLINVPMSSLTGASRGQPIGTLNGNPVYPDELNRAKREWEYLNQPYTYQFDGRQIVPVSAATELGGAINRQMNEHPELFLLLWHEADQRGIQVSDDLVKTVIQNRFPAPAKLPQQYLPLYQDAIRHYLMVKALRDRLESDGKYTEPAWRHYLSENQQHVILDLVEFNDEQLGAAATAPTTQQVEALYDEYKDVLPGGPGSRTHDPLGFAYELPNRVKLQYVTISRKQVIDAVKAKQDAYELEVKARKYYDEHEQDFVRAAPATSLAPSTGSTTSPSPTTPSIAPTTRPAATGPATQPGAMLFRPLHKSVLNIAPVADIEVETSSLLGLDRLQDHVTCVDRNDSGIGSSGWGGHSCLPRIDERGHSCPPSRFDNSGTNSSPLGGSEYAPALAALRQTRMSAPPKTAAALADSWRTRMSAPPESGSATSEVMVGTALTNTFAGLLQTGPAVAPATRPAAALSGAVTQPATTQSATTEPTGGSTQPAGATSASTQPIGAATQSSAAPPSHRPAAPTTRPYEEVREEIIDLVLKDDADKLQKQITDALSAKLDADWKAYHAAHPTTEASSPTTGTSQPATGAAEPTAQTAAPATQPSAPTTQPIGYDSYAYLEQAALEIQKKFNVLPEVRQIANWEDLSELAREPGIGMAQAGDRYFPVYATEDAAPFVTDPAARKSALELWQPSVPLTGADQSAYIFRLTAASPAHAPPLLEVRARVERDARLKKGYEAALADAKKLMDSAKAHGLASAAIAMHKAVVSTGAFSPTQEPDQFHPIPSIPNFSGSPAAVGMLMAQARDLLTQATPANPHPIAIVDLPGEQRVLVAQLADVIPTLPESQRYREKLRDTRMLEMQIGEFLASTWFDYKNVVARLHYKADTSGNGE